MREVTAEIYKEICDGILGVCGGCGGFVALDLAFDLILTGRDVSFGFNDRGLFDSGGFGFG